MSGPTLASKIHSNTTADKDMENANPSTLFMSSTDEHEMYKVALSCLKLYKCDDFDNIKPSVLRKVILYIVKPLTHIIHLSLLTDIVLDRIQIEKVIPFYQ